MASKLGLGEKKQVKIRRQKINEKGATERKEEGLKSDVRRQKEKKKTCITELSTMNATSTNDKNRTEQYK